MWEFNPFTSTFDMVSKENINDGSASGQMVFWNGSKWVNTETSELFWDDTNKRFGVGCIPTKTLEVNGEIYAKGDLNSSTDGSSTTTPRVFGFKDLTSGEACRFQFGDKHNGFQNAYAHDVQIFSYWGIQLVGGMQNYSDDFEPPAFEKLLDVGVLVKSVRSTSADPGNAGNPIVTFAIKGNATQSTNLQEWRDSDNNVLSFVDKDGIATLADGSLLKTSAAPTSDAMIVNKKYVDDNLHSAVTLAGKDYLTLSGQQITANLIDLADDVTGILPIANGGTGSSTKNFVDLSNAQTIAGVKTFSAFPVTPSLAPSSDYQVANKKYVDDNGGSSPLTTKGDLFGYDTADTRIPIGTDGQVLTADSSEALGLKWASASGGSSYWDRDSGNGYLTPSTDTDSIVLKDTTANKIGVIYKGNYNFIHNFYGSGTDGKNLFVGVRSGNFTLGGTYSYQGSYNNGIGYQTLYGLTGGYQNNAMGCTSLHSVTTGYKNNGMGYQTLYSLTTGSENTAVGADSMSIPISARKNVAVGSNTINYSNGMNNVAVGYKTGKGAYGYDYSYNTFLGAQSGYLMRTGTNNIFLGYDAGYRQTTNSNLLIIDNQLRADTATEESNAILYGTMASSPASQDLRVNADLFLKADNRNLFFGAGDDVKMFYDGTDMKIVTDEVTASDLIIDCGTEKTVELKEVVWDDQQVNIGDIAGRGWFGNSWSEIVEYRSGIALKLENSTSDGYKFKFNAQLNHKYEEGEDIQFHIHTGADGTTSGDVVLKFTYEWQSINSVFPSSTSVTKTFTVNGTSGTHQVMDFAANMTGTNQKVSSIVLANVERLANDAADTFTGDLYVIGVDYHVPLNTIGSRTEWVK